MVIGNLKKKREIGGGSTKVNMDYLFGVDCPTHGIYIPITGIYQLQAGQRMLSSLNTE